jgi:hypothetical protein
MTSARLWSKNSRSSFIAASAPPRPTTAHGCSPRQRTSAPASRIKLCSDSATEPAPSRTMPLVSQVAPGRRGAKAGSDCVLLPVCRWRRRVASSNWLQQAASTSRSQQAATGCIKQHQASARSSLLQQATCRSKQQQAAASNYRLQQAATGSSKQQLVAISNNRL